MCNLNALMVYGSLRICFLYTSKRDGEFLNEFGFILFSFDSVWYGYVLCGCECSVLDFICNFKNYIELCWLDDILWRLLLCID